MRPELKTFVSSVLNISLDVLDDDAELGITPGWDSMAYLRLLSALEREYNIELNEDTVEKYRKLSAIAALDEEVNNG